MNMILHGVHYRKFDIRQEDTLEHPQHIDQQFEAIVANPPFSAQWSANPLFTTDDRFSQYGKLAPSSKADYAFVQHMNGEYRKKATELTPVFTIHAPSGKYPESGLFALACFDLQSSLPRFFEDDSLNPFHSRRREHAV